MMKHTLIACFITARLRFIEHELEIAKRSADVQLSLPHHANIVQLLGVAWLI